MFMNQEEFTTITESLDSSQPLARRREALQTLLQVPPSDVLAVDNWARMKKGLVAALADSDENLSVSQAITTGGIISKPTHT